MKRNEITKLNKRKERGWPAAIASRDGNICAEYGRSGFGSEWWLWVRGMVDYK